MATCSKIFGAFTCCCCTCQENQDQHNSHPQQHSNASQPTHDHAHEAHQGHNQNIVADSQGANASKFPDERQHHAFQPHGKQGGQKPGPDTTDDRFSSNSKEDEEQNDTTKDAFSDYIKRVKIKIRKTTSIASRKSFKESKLEKPGT